jgi:hypothetical protein
LPGFAVRPEAVDPGIRELCDALAEECYRVDEWEAAEGFTFEAFHASGLRAGRGLLGTIGDCHGDSSRGRGLVISPFLDDGALRAFAKSFRSMALVSRVDSLAKLKCICDPGLRIDAFAFADIDDIEPSSEDGEGDLSDGRDSLVDLHAKLVVVEDGTEASWFLGSANATPSGLGGRNVEFMVELSGSKKDIGIEALIGDRPEDRYSLRRMLLPWDPTRAPPPEKASDDEVALDRCCAFLARLRLQATAAERESGLYSLRYSCDSLEKAFEEPAQFSVRPLSLDKSAGRSGLPLLSGEELQFEGISREALTPLVVLSVMVGEAEREFVLAIPVAGLPMDRLSRLIARLIEDTESFLRFIRLLLGEEDQAVGVEAVLGASGTWKVGFGNGFDAPLFEMMLRTAASEPRRLAGIARFLRELEEGGAAVVPEEFKALWRAVIEAVGEEALR